MPRSARSTPALRTFGDKTGSCTLRAELGAVRNSGTQPTAHIYSGAFAESDHAPVFFLDRCSARAWHSASPSRSLVLLILLLSLSLLPRLCRLRRQGARGRRGTRRRLQLRARRGGARKALWRRALSSPTTTESKAPSKGRASSGSTGAAQAGACWTWRAGRERVKGLLPFREKGARRRTKKEGRNCREQEKG